MKIHPVSESRSKDSSSILETTGSIFSCQFELQINLSILVKVSINIIIISGKRRTGGGKGGEEILGFLMIDGRNGWASSDWRLSVLIRILKITAYGFNSNMYCCTIC